jgi:acyl-CoA hydrolase
MRSDPDQNASPAIEMQEIVFPHHANHLGTLFGGQALAWMDKAAFIAATAAVGGVVVTARSEAVDFIAPVRVGDIVTVRAALVSRGRRSLQVDVDLSTGLPQAILCARGRFVMVRTEAV